jgi:adenosylcobinamide-GDP ribazoletransferase
MQAFLKVSNVTISFIKFQCTLFFYALSYFTRLPVPHCIVFDNEQFHKANAYLPLIGLLVGLAMFTIFYICQLLFSIPISILLMLIGAMLITGALHEDGFADCCDGFGGGYNTTQRLKIMKDSQIGSYAGIGLVVLLLLKFNLLLALTEIATSALFISLIIAHVASRYGALCVMQTMPYVRLAKDGKVLALSKKLNRNYFLVSSFVTLLAFCLLPIKSAFLLISVLVMIGLLLRTYFNKTIGGYTGDCLGFSQQCLEITILLLFTVLLA